MALEDDAEEEVEANDFGQLRREVQRDKDRERKYITHGAESEQKAMQRLALTTRKKQRHMGAFAEKRGKMKKIAKMMQRKLLKGEGEK